MSELVVKKIKYNEKTNAIEFDLNSGKQSGEGVLNSLKNSKKLDLLIKKGVDIHIYPEKMIKLLLDGDYNKELKNFKSKIVQFAHEIIEKKVPVTKLGVQTNLYKIVSSLKKGGSLVVNDTDRKPRRSKKVVAKKQIKTVEKTVEKPAVKPVIKEPSIIEQALNKIKQLLQTNRKIDALNILVKYVPSNHPLYYKIYSHIIDE